MLSDTTIIRVFNTLQDYTTTWQAMQDVTQKRHQDTEDQIWLMQHLPVYTQGRAGKPEHVLNPGNIPIVQTDRGGQVTYHGPGQLMIYTLLDIDRLGLNTRSLVCMQEQWIITLLKQYQLDPHRVDNAPGIYINNAKIASIGLRVTKGRCYHGMALNVDMDLSPFSGINPCGYSQLNMTHINQHTTKSMPEVIHDIQSILLPPSKVI